MAVDFMVIGMLLLGFFIGWKKGLIKIVSCPLGILLAIYLAVRYTGSLGNGLNREFELVNWWSGVFVQHSILNRLGVILQSLLSPFETVVEVICTLLIDPGTGVATFTPARFLAAFLLCLLSFLILLITVKIVFNLLIRFITKGLDRTFVGTFNRFFGGLVGLIISVILCGAIAILTTSLYSVPAAAGEPGALGRICQGIGQSQLAGEMKDLVCDYLLGWN